MATPTAPKPGADWVAVGDGWVPPDHPLAKQATATPTQNTQTPVAGDLAGDQVMTEVKKAAPAPGAASTGGGDMTPQQATAAGLSWVPKDHPLYGTAGFVGSSGAGASTGGQAGTTGATPGGAYTPPNAAPGTPSGTPLATQSANAQTYSQTPGAAPTEATTNQGVQDVWRNKLLQMASQSTDVDTNDPTFRNQSDAYRAQVTRAAREMQADQAVAAGPTGGYFARGQQRVTGENAAQAAGQFEAQLAGRELQNKRDEIKSALSSLGAGLENDQRRALEKKLGELNASIQKLGIETGASTAASEIALKGELGRGGLNVDLMRALLQNQQFGTSAGIDIADKEAYWNNAALQKLL